MCIIEVLYTVAAPASFEGKGEGKRKNRRKGIKCARSAQKYDIFNAKIGKFGLFYQFNIVWGKTGREENIF